MSATSALAVGAVSGSLLGWLGSEGEGGLKNSYLLTYVFTYAIMLFERGERNDFHYSNRIAQEYL